MKKEKLLLSRFASNVAHTPAPVGSVYAILAKKPLSPDPNIKQFTEELYRSTGTNKSDKLLHLIVFKTKFLNLLRIKIDFDL